MKIVPQFDTYPRLVTFGQTALGKAVLAVAFAAGLAANGLDSWLATGLAVALVAYFPARRRLLLSIAALCWLVYRPTWINWDFLRGLAREGQIAETAIPSLVFRALAGMFCLVAVFFVYTRKRRGSMLAKRPVLCLVAGYAAMLGAVGLLPLAGAGRLAAWTAVAVAGPYLWYLAYALKDASSKAPDGLLAQFGALRPFWGGTNVPFPKGSANLRKIEARTPKELSVIQLKAVKLLIWVLILRTLERVLMAVVHGAPDAQMVRLAAMVHSPLPSLGVPPLQTAVEHPVLSVWLAWASVFAHFVRQLLWVSTGPNLIVACCRMSGFYALRNSRRPLAAQTAADFWNRYYYYFKELLVEFFFFPVFTRYFKKHARLRLFAATLAAATVGNMIYHFLRDYEYVAAMGLWGALAGFRVYAFYAAVLGIGIGISQLRSHARGGAPEETRWWRRGLATAGVLLFFSVLEIFDQEGRSLGLGSCFRFLLGLFAIRV
jgi:hypothetical protein